jgi:hypothetical protein
VAVYLGLAVLLATASLVALNSRGGESTPIARVIRPKAGSACSSPPNGYLYSNTVDGTTMNVCVSQEGNINQIDFPTATSPQIAWDGYCLVDGDTNTKYNDFSPGSGVSFSGWNAATLTVAATNQVNVTRTSSDGKYQLTEFIKINFQPRSVFVGMTVKNVDPANVTHRFAVSRDVAPAIDGSAANDQYNEFGVGLFAAPGIQTGRTGQASQSPGPGTNSLLFGPTQQGGFVLTSTVASFQAAGGCSAATDPPGLITGGNRVLVAALGDSVTHNSKIFSLAHNQSAQVGKFVYRML